MSHTSNRWVRINNILPRQAQDTLSNTVTTEQFFLSQFKCDVATLTAGRTFRGKYRMLLTTNAAFAGTIMLKLYLVSGTTGTKTLIGSSSTMVVATALSNIAMVIEHSLNIVTGGNPATMEAQGEGRMFPTQGGAVSGFSMSNAAALTSTDLTQPQSLQIGVTYSSLVGTAITALVLPTFEYTEV